MAWAFVQSEGNSGEFGGGGAATQAFDSDVTVGNTIILAVTANPVGDPGQTFTVSDDLGNTYTAVTSPVVNVGSGSNCTVALYWAPVTTGGACTVSVTPSGAPNVSMAIAEYSGLAASSPVDGFSTNTGISSTTPDSGSVSVGSAGELLVATVGGENDSAGSVSAGSGFTSRFSGLFPIICLQDKSVSTATNATWTYGFSNEFAAMAASFKLAGGGTASGAGTADGLATASGVGASKFAGVGSAAGIATASGVGASKFAGVGSSTGVATANAVGASNFSGVGSAAGVATASAVGASNFSGVGSAAGVATASGVGSSTGSGSVGTADGTSTATASGGGGSVPDIGGVWLASPRSLRWLVRR